MMGKIKYVTVTAQQITILTLFICVLNLQMRATVPTAEEALAVIIPHLMSMRK